MKKGVKAKPMHVRFWGKVDYDQDVSKCWNWTGSLCNWGYGSFGVVDCKGEWKTSKAHRVAFILANRVIDNNLFVMHTCDNRRCCNPTHLKLGTAMDNTKDMLEKRRHRNLKKTHCKRGHEFTPENTYIVGGYRRSCRTCMKAASLYRTIKKHSK